MPELPSGNEDNLDSVDDIINALGEDDDKDQDEPKDKKPPIELEIDDAEDDDDKGDKKGSKDKDDDKDEEDEDEEDEEEKLDLKADITAPPRKAEIEKAFPGFFKKFGWFEKMMFRDKEINELFGGFDGAKEAHEKAQVFDELDTHLSRGSSVELFERLKDNDPKTFSKLARTLLPTLQKVDKEAYVDVSLDLIKRTLIHAYTDGKNANNEELMNACKSLSSYIFPRGFDAPEEREPAKDEELEKDREAFQNERLETAVTDVTSRISNVLKSTVESYIDPKGEMTEFTKKQAIKQVLSSVDESLKENKVFQSEKNKLWKEYIDSRFNKNVLDKIKRLYLGKAKGLLRDAILQTRREALKDAPRKRKDNEEETPPKRILSPGRSTSQQSGKSERLKMKPGESVADFLSRDD